MSILDVPQFGMRTYMEKGADTRTFLRIVEISGLWKIDYSYFGIKLMDCENFFINIEYLAYS